MRFIVCSWRLAISASTKLCAEFAATVASGIAAPLIGQIDPIRIGEMQRATSVAYEYGKRLDSYTQNLRSDALKRLISAYPAHGFVIDRKEAKELFNRVHSLSDAEEEFCSERWVLVHKQLDFDPIFITIEEDRDEDSDAPGATQPPAAEGSPGDAGSGAGEHGGDDPKDAGGSGI